MTGFSSDWLDAREPVDHAARSSEILSAVAFYFSREKSLRITDIGCGTGSTLRALKPLLHNELRWHLIDNDDALLGIARECAKDDHMEFSQCDLSQSLDLLFKDGPSLITTSAFLDLVSLKWLTKLCGEITRRKIPFYAALSYDGRCVCDPPHIHDDKVLTAFNRHQGTDKGFGPALGPKAANSAVALFEKAGYLVSMAQSDWIGDKRHPEFQEMLLKGWWEAACEVNPDDSGCFDNWLKDRLWLLNNGNSTVRVGHLDIFAVPKD